MPLLIWESLFSAFCTPSLNWRRRRCAIAEALRPEIRRSASRRLFPHPPTLCPKSNNLPFVEANRSSQPSASDASAAVVTRSRTRSEVITRCFSGSSPSFRARMLFATVSTVAVASLPNSPVSSAAGMIFFPISSALEHERSLSSYQIRADCRFKAVDFRRRRIESQNNDHVFRFIFRQTDRCYLSHRDSR